MGVKPAWNGYILGVFGVTVMQNCFPHCIHQQWGRDMQRKTLFVTVGHIFSKQHETEREKRPKHLCGPCAFMETIYDYLCLSGCVCKNV